LGVKDPAKIGKVVNCLKSTSKNFEQKIKVQVVKRGTPFSFLARFWFCWDGSLNSICDIARQLSKFHLTRCLPDNVTAYQKLREKAMSLYLTDCETPIVGEFVTTVLDWLNRNGHHNGVEGLTSWWGAYSLEQQFPNEPEEWMQLLEASYVSVGFNYDIFKKAMKDVAEGKLDPLELPLP